MSADVFLSNVVSFNFPDEKQSFEEWFQDLQLAVNECFENPESRTNVETSLQRLAVSWWMCLRVVRNCRFFLDDGWMLAFSSFRVS